jgi:hypothetical protein
MNPPFQCWQDLQGDLWVAAGRVVSINATATNTFSTNTAIAGGVQSPSAGNASVAAVASASKILSGGSGRNWKISGGPADPAFPTGVFRPNEPEVWDSPEFGDAYMERDPSDGSVVLNDGTNDVATGSGAGLHTGTRSAGTFVNQDYALESTVGDIKTYRGLTDATYLIIFDTNSGNSSVVEDVSFDQIALRAAIDYDTPNGSYAASAQAETDFNGGSAWDYTITGGGLTTTMTATTYGETTYNSGNPFTFDAEFEGDITGQSAAVVVDSGTLQEGNYSWTGWQEFTSDDNPTISISIDGTGAGEISDGTDVIAARAADASKLYDPGGAYASTAYGAATYGTSENVISGSPSAGTAISQDWVLFATVGAIDTYRGESDWYIEHDTGTGDAILYDGTGNSVADRLAGSTANINGTYNSTDYAEEVYNAAASFTYAVATNAEDVGFSVTVTTRSKATMAGYVYVVLEINGSNEADGILGPFFAASMPANTATEKSIPIAYSDGAGNVEQIQVGPIMWVA